MRDTKTAEFRRRFNIAAKIPLYRHWTRALNENFFIWRSGQYGKYRSCEFITDRFGNTKVSFNYLHLKTRPEELLLFPEWFAEQCKQLAPLGMSATLERLANSVTFCATAPAPLVNNGDYWITVAAKEACGAL